MGTTKVGAEQLRGVARQFPPFFSEITPNFTTPNTQIEATIKGEFFTPDMTVVGNGFTVNNFIFIDTKTVKAFIMTAGVDGNYAITLDNGSGTPTVKSNVFTVSQGNVIVPTLNDWTPISAMNTLNLNTPGEIIMLDNFTGPIVRWNQTIDMTRKWRIIFSPKISPFFAELTTIPRGDTNNGHYVKLFNLSTGVEIGAFGFWGNILRSFGPWTSLALGTINLNPGGATTGSLSAEASATFTFEWDLTTFKFINMSNTVAASAASPSYFQGVTQVQLEFKLWQIDIDSVKYIELP